jgi:tetratricopeptide (TPR) repeat protein
MVQKGFIELKFGNIYYDLRLYEKSIPFYEEALCAFKDADNKIGQAKAQYNLALAFSSIGQKEKAESMFAAAYDQFEELDDKTSKIETLLGLGNIYYEKGLSDHNFIDKAIKTYESALMVDENNLEYNEKIWHNLANSKYERGYIDEALDIYKSHLSLSKLQNVDDRIILFSNLATIYFRKECWQNAIDLYKDYLDMDDSDKLRSANVLFNIAYSYFKLGDFVESINYYKKSHELFGSLGLKHFQGKCSLNLCISYRHMCDKKNLIECLNRSLIELDKYTDEYNYASRLLGSMMN